jgi:hypothetical protein
LLRLIEPLIQADKFNQFEFFSKIKTDLQYVQLGAKFPT